MPTSRRTALAAAGALGLSPLLLAQSAPPKPLHLLILGGTGFTGPHQVRYALSRGHKVTLFNRGRRAKREWPGQVEELTGDRSTNDYASLKDRRFDACIDNPSSLPFWVRDAGRALQDRVAHFLFISTISVYASNAEPGADERAATLPYEGKDAMAETMDSLRANMALYGPLKAECEREAERQFPGRTSIIRPGLIVGPGDETDRWSYWPLRLQRGGPALVPPAADPVSFIDARDLAEWTIRLAEQRAFGAFNAVGPATELSMGSMLAQMQSALGSQAELVEAPLAFLQAEQVAPWSDLPVWVPPQGDYAGMHKRSNARARAAGLRFRDVGTTTRDFMAWWQGLDEKRRATLRAGLKPEREAALLAKLKG